MSSDGAKLYRAARAGDDAKVKRLLKAKADVDGSNVAFAVAPLDRNSPAWEGQGGRAGR